MTWILGGTYVEQRNSRAAYLAIGGSDRPRLLTVKDGRFVLEVASEVQARLKRSWLSYAEVVGLWGVTCEQVDDLVEREWYGQDPAVIEARENKEPAGGFGSVHYSATVRLRL